MKTTELTFPDDERIDEPYRGKRFAVGYEIKIDDGGVDSHVYVGGREVRGYAATWVIDQVRHGRPIEKKEIGSLILY